MTADLILALILVWFSGILIGYGVAKWRQQQYENWLVWQVGRLTAENMKLREHIESERDPADYWKKNLDE